MKHLKAILLGLCIAYTVGEGVRAGLLLSLSRPPGNSPDGNLDEDFEAGGSVPPGGFDLSGWTTAGSSGGITNADDTTSPAPLAGAQSFTIASPAFGQTIAYIDMFPSSAVGTNEMSFYLMCHWRTQQVNTTFFMLGATNTDAMLRLQTGAGGAINLYVGLDATTPGFKATTVATTTAGTTFHFWGNYAKGSSGINSTGRVWFATNSNIRPASGNSFAEIVNGTNGFNVEWLFLAEQNFSAVADMNLVVDKIRVRKGPIANIDAIIP